MVEMQHLAGLGVGVALGRIDVWCKLSGLVI